MSEATLDIVANTDKALKAIEDFSGKSAKSLSGIENSFKNVEKSASQFATSSASSASSFTAVLGGVGVAAAALIALFAGAKIKAFFEDAIDAAAEQEVSIQKLNAALAANGEFTELASKELQNFANTMEDTTGVSDAQVLSLIAVAKSFGATNEQAEKIVESSINYAAVTKTSVDKAVKQLSKSLDGQEGILFKNTDAFKGLTKEQKANGEGINRLYDDTQGLAKAFNQTYNGAVKRVSDAFEDNLKQIGFLIIKNPVLIGVLNTLADSLRVVASFVEENSDQIKLFINTALYALAATVSDIILGLNLFSYQIDLLKVGLTGLASAITGMVSTGLNAINFLIDGFSKIVAIAITPAVTGIESLAKVLNKLGGLSDENLSSITGIASSLAKASNEGVGALDGLIEKVDGLKDASFTAFDTAVNGIGSTREGIGKASDSVRGFFTGIVNVGLAATNTSKIFGDLNGNTLRTEKEFEEAAKGADDLKKSLEELIKTIEKEEAAANPIAGIEKAAADSLEVLQNSLDKGLILQEQYAELTERIAISAAKRIADEEDKINEAKFEADLKEYQDFIDTIKQKASEGLASPFLTATQAQGALGKPEADSFTTQNADTISQVIGGIDAALQGAQGAVKAVSATAGVIADTILPGIGGAVSGIVTVLSQGPEKVKELVEGFAKALPSIVRAIGEALPVVIQVLADNLDEIIIGLAKNFPIIVKALVKASPEIAAALVQVVPELVKALLEEIKDSFGASGLDEKFSSLGEKFGDAAEPFLTTIGDGINNLGAGLGQILGKIVGGVSDLLNGIFGVIQPILNGLSTLLNNTLGVFLDGLGQGLSLLTTGLSQAYTGIVTFFSDLPTQLASGFQTAISGLVAGTSGAFLGVTDFIAGLGPKIGESLAPARDFIGSIGGKLSAAFSGLGEGFLNVIKNLSIKLPEFKFPNFPSFKFPDLPKFSFPSFPSFKFPDFPSFKFPALPTFKFPEFKLPEIKIPEFKLPELKFPKFEWPEFPKFEWPNIKVELPDLGGGGGGGGIIDSVSSFFGLAGGGMVPQGFPNDTFPAALTSGEVVIDRDLTSRLENFLNQGGNSGSNQPVQVVLQIGEKQLADVLLNISRQGFRTA